MTDLGVGPYCDEDMSDWWVPVSAQPNRMKAAHEVRQCMDDDSVLRYVGVDEDAAFDLFVAYAPVRHATVTAAFVDVGSVATFAHQRGGLLSLQLAF